MSWSSYHVWNVPGLVVTGGLIQIDKWYLPVVILGTLALSQGFGD